MEKHTLVSGDAIHQAVEPALQRDLHTSRLRRDRGRHDYADAYYGVKNQGLERFDPVFVPSSLEG